MRMILYGGAGLVLCALIVAMADLGFPTDLLGLLDLLFMRAAIVVLLYLLWRFVRAYEARNAETRRDL